MYGPGTFINEAAGQISDRFRAQVRARAAQADRAERAARQLALKKGRSGAEARRLGRQARQLVYAQFLSETYRLAARYGLRSTPDISDPAFVQRIVFSDRVGEPKERFAYLFPTRSSALIQVRLRPELPERERRAAIATIREAVAMPQWRLTEGRGTYAVTGAPVVADDLADRAQRLDPAAAGRRAGGHGADARARVPRAPAAAAARRRPRRGRR